MPVGLSKEERDKVSELLGEARLRELDTTHDSLEGKTSEHYGELLSLRATVRERDSQLASEKAGREQAIADATSAHRAAVQRAQATDALVRAGVNAAALKAAIPCFLAEATFDLRSDGTVRSTTIDGETLASLEVAAMKFLDRSPFFHAHYDRDAERVIEPGDVLASRGDRDQPTPDYSPLAEGLARRQETPATSSEASARAAEEEMANGAFGISGMLGVGLQRHDAQQAEQARLKLPTRRQAAQFEDHKPSLLSFGMRQKDGELPSGGGPNGAA